MLNCTPTDITYLKSYASYERAVKAIESFIEKKALKDVWYIIATSPCGRFVPAVILSRRQLQEGYHHDFTSGSKGFKVISKG